MVLTPLPPSSRENSVFRYMLFEMVPDVSLTGGPWYSGSDFDREFILQLSEFVVRLSQAKVKKAAKEFAERPLQRLQAGCFTALGILTEINSSGVHVLLCCFCLFV